MLNYEKAVTTKMPPPPRRHSNHIKSLLNLDHNNRATFTKMGILKQKELNYQNLHLNIGARNYIEDYFESISAQVLQKCGPVPQHIAFCMDGNRRYAKKSKLEDGGGHIAGFASMMRILVACHRLGVKCATVYAFSIENFNRSPEESEVLFNLVRTKLWDMVNNKDSTMRQLGWQVRFPGHRSMLQDDLIERIKMIESITAQSNGMVVNICAPYTTRDDLTSAIQVMASENNISKELLEKSRHMADSEPLDIFVRTSGETRLSDFMAWEIDSGCSMEFIPNLWPEFTVWKLFQLVVKWQQRREKNSRLALKALGPSPPLVSVSKKHIVNA